MTWVGYVYLKGRGVAIDAAKASTWLMKAAAAGDGEAMTWIGHTHLHGDGVPVDFDLAREWYLKAAEAGDADAMFQMGQLHLHGHGVDTDIRLAQEWYLKAADAGDGDAMCSLGCMFSEGGELPGDPTAARRWFLASAEAGNATGQQNYASVLYEAGEDIEADRWMRKAAEQGKENAIRYLREQDIHKLLVEKRYVEALPSLMSAVNVGSAWAREWLGYLHLHGHGVTKNPREAIQHYQAAYDAGRRSAARDAGVASFKAELFEAALEWFGKDTDRSASSLYWQFRVLQARPQLERHAGERDELLLEAANSGHVFARRALALLMMKGHKRFGSRRQGLWLFCQNFKQAMRLMMKNRQDPRLL